MFSRFAITLILLMAVSFSVQAQRFGGHEGNGGDICENRFKIVRDDLSSWLASGGAKGLILPAGISSAEYLSRMTKAISTAKISCVNEAILVQGAQKTCQNKESRLGRKLITCDERRFMSISESDQYVLVHHEFAGIAGFETNDQDGSQYQLSNQITGFLEDQVVKRLAVRRQKSLTSNDKSFEASDLAQLPIGTVFTVPVDHITSPSHSEIRSLDIFRNSVFWCEVTFESSSNREVLKGVLEITTRSLPETNGTRDHAYFYVLSKLNKVKTRIETFICRPVDREGGSDRKTVFTIKDLRTGLASVGGRLQLPPPTAFR